MDVIVPDYLYTVDVPGIDNERLYQDCMDIEQHLIETLENPRPSDGYGCFSSANHRQYNMFNFDNPELTKLYEAIQSNVLPLMGDEPYSIQCWFNVFRSGDFIDWHAHWPPSCRVWHGFYCCHVGKSYTHYRIGDDYYDVQGHDGLLVFGKSDGDEHRSGDWRDSETHRITIAFDIVPTEYAQKSAGVYLPI